MTNNAENCNQRIDLEKIVLEQPWDGGYLAFDSVSAMEFVNQAPRPPRDSPQLDYDPEIDALTIVAGTCVVYDDNGYMDAGWDYLPNVRRLAVPVSQLVALVQEKRAAEVTLPAELTMQSGKVTFDFDCTVEQARAIKEMKELDETTIPHWYGYIAYKFSYGALRLTLIPREPDRTGIIVGGYTPVSDVMDQRVINFFTNPAHFPETIPACWAPR
jgi:hypothetical protein